jgi:hypothetical protein
MAPNAPILKIIPVFNKQDILNRNMTAFPQLFPIATECSLLIDSMYSAEKLATSHHEELKGTNISNKIETPTCKIARRTTKCEQRSNWNLVVIRGRTANRIQATFIACS